MESIYRRKDVSSMDRYHPKSTQVRQTTTSRERFNRGECREMKESNRHG